ncbi:hypothetical protein JTE90_026571 [Oedothorax gibbosus]|uniref:Interferon alpha-inducible protein 27-like protein 2A n=1 Tax=Oedothorax gibbosus TaxID=931172 RepID=A0AAV6U2B4_9ARAC|nr:hypothetical protein JTE90_026571 [Oedothorax gibbosus]
MVVGTVLAVVGTAAAAVVGAVLFLPAAGFTTAGVASGSLAAATQSSIGSVAAGSIFATLQSAGVLGLAAGTKAAIAAAGGAVGGLLSNLFG